MASFTTTTKSWYFHERTVLYAMSTLFGDDSNDRDERRPKDVDDERPHEGNERRLVDVDADGCRVVLRGLEDGTGGGDADVDADENGDDEDGLEDVVHHGEAGAEPVDLGVAVGGDGGENAHGAEDANAELNLLLLRVSRERSTTVRRRWEICQPQARRNMTTRSRSSTKEYMKEFMNSAKGRGEGAAAGGEGY